MPIDPSQRPKRFIVIPKVGADEAVPAAATTWRLMQGVPTHGTTALQAGRRDGRRVAAKKAVPTLKKVNTSPADGAVLVEASSAAQVQADAPAGAKVYEEHWYSLERPPRPWLKLSAALKAPRTRTGHTRDLVVKVVLEDEARTRLPNARITILVDEANGVGDDAVSDGFGRVRFMLSKKTERLDAVIVDPLHSGWPVRLSDVDIGPADIEVVVPVIDVDAVDVRGLIYGAATSSAGHKVSVGVVDTGVGPHGALTLAGGLNTTTESPRRTRDQDGHGSHVAGVIASSAAGWRRGEAPGVALYAYRIFEKDDPYASSFAIESAIKQAALDGCDLINLSIGDSVADDAIRDAVEFAWARGCVCVAATGNDGLGHVDYPARYARAVAVSAVGLENSRLAGTNLAWALSGARGKQLASLDTFFASFSNRGAKVALTAPGVAVVSTIFGNRWGVMSGTSMATPIATGVLARRLAASPGVLDMPRDSARAAAIVKLARDHAEDLGLPARMQGAGLAR